jgi:hypothetical protein
MRKFLTDNGLYDYMDAAFINLPRLCLESPNRTWKQSADGTDCFQVRRPEF